MKGCHISELDFVVCDPKRYKEDQHMKVTGRKITAPQFYRITYQREHGSARLGESEISIVKTKTVT